MKTQAVNVKIQLDSAAFVNSDGDFDNGILRMNMDMVFQTGGANNSSCLIMQIKWAKAGLIGLH
jgi:hypothetical protein